MSSKRLRLTVIGNCSAGKTSLVHALVKDAYEASSTKREGSEIVEVREWYPNPRDSDLQLDVWNVRANNEHLSVNNLFLRDDSLFLLVVELLGYELTDESFHVNIGVWIQMLKSRVERPVVMLAIMNCLRVDSVNRIYREYCDNLEDDKCRHIKNKIAELQTNGGSSITVGIANPKEIRYDTTRRILMPSSRHFNNIPYPTRNTLRSLDPVVIPVSEGIPLTIVQSGDNVSVEVIQPERILKVNEQIYQTANNTRLFPHLNCTLSAMQLEIKKRILQLKNQRNGPRFLTITQIDQWLCQHSMKFRNDPQKGTILQQVLRYLIRLGIVLQFEDIRELKEFIFFDPNWLSVLVKNVIRRDLWTRLRYLEEFKAYNLDPITFNHDKMDLCEKGLSSESLLRCILHDTVPASLHFNQISPLLEYLDVGYTFSKESESAGEHVRKKYILIQPHIPDAPSRKIVEIWATGASSDVLEIKSVYQFSSRVPNGLLERFIVQSFNRSDDIFYWKTGIVGLSNSDGAGEVKYLITKTSKNGDTIELSARARSSVNIKTVWSTMLRLHLTFANLLSDLWPKQRYLIHNKCPNCRQCHFPMDVKEAVGSRVAHLDELTCRNGDRHKTILVNSELVYPPPTALQDLQNALQRSSQSGSGILDMTEDFAEVRRSIAVSGDELIKREILGHRVRQEEKPSTQEAPCKSLIVFSTNDIPQGILRLIHDELVNTNPVIVPVKEYFQLRNILVMHIQRPAIGVVVIEVVETVLRVTFTNVLSAATGRSEESVRGFSCQCNEIFKILDGILHAGRFDFRTLMCCKGKSFLLAGDEAKPVDVELIIRIETLAMELRRHKEAINNLGWRNSKTEGNKCEAGTAVPKMNQTNQVWMRDLTEIRSKYSEILKRLHKVYVELEVQSNTWRIRNESERAAASNTEQQAYEDATSEGQKPSNSAGGHSSENPQNNRREGSFQRFAVSGGTYPLSKLLQFFSDNLLTEDWEKLRLAISNHISPTVLQRLQNGVEIFDELVRCNHIGDGKLDLLRKLFYKIQRVDYVHLIDCAKEGDYSLLDNEDEQQAHGMDAPNDTGYPSTSRACLPLEFDSIGRGSHDKNNHSESSHGESRLQEPRRFQRNDGLNERLEFSCEHYDRYCDVQFSCCEEFWPCHRCHNSESKCGKEKLRSRDIKLIKCKRCNTIQEFPKEVPYCVECGLKFAEYFCPICQHLTGKQSYPYHCEGCGICRVHEDRSFHCDVCGVCLDIHLLENHLCRAGSAHDECCICFEDAFSGCQILPCSHKVHKDCATMMLQNGITKCPICRQSFAHLVERRIVQQ